MLRVSAFGTDRVYQRGRLHRTLINLRELEVAMEQEPIAKKVSAKELRPKGENIR